MLVFALVVVVLTTASAGRVTASAGRVTASAGRVTASARRVTASARRGTTSARRGTTSARRSRGYDLAKRSAGLGRARYCGARRHIDRFAGIDIDDTNQPFADGYARLFLFDLDIELGALDDGRQIRRLDGEVLRAAFFDAGRHHAMGLEQHAEIVRQRLRRDFDEALGRQQHRALIVHQEDAAVAAGPDGIAGIEFAVRIEPDPGFAIMDLDIAGHALDPPFGGLRSCGEKRQGQNTGQTRCENLAFIHHVLLPLDPIAC